MNRLTSTPFRRLRTPALAGLATVFALSLANASSHREAPFVTELPKIDATDFYMFTSYEPGRQDNVILVANYLPLQDPYGGPNYFSMDPEASYEINIDNDGDAIEDITFRFRFNNQLQDIQLPVGPPGSETLISVPLVNVGPILGPNDPNANIKESYSVALIQNGTGFRLTNPADGTKQFDKPIDNIGTKSITNYSAYSDQFVYDIDLPGGFTGRMFVGQRKDPFVVNLGETFDLVNTNPIGPEDGEEDDLADKNVTSMILEIPKDFLTTPGQPVLGAWTTAWLPRRARLEVDPTFEDPTTVGGPQVQVSRLGMPLVNEVVIGLPDKNKFNASRPFDDGQFLDYVSKPTLPEILELLFGVQAPNFFPRADLEATFLTGFAGLNANGSVGEMLRLNTLVPPVPASSQSRMGLLAGDQAGFPNGRRPGDDVVDITLRVAMGAILPPSLAPDGQLPFTDGAIVDASFFDEAFPFLRDPLPGAN